MFFRNPPSFTAVQTIIKEHIGRVGSLRVWATRNAMAKILKLLRGLTAPQLRILHLQCLLSDISDLPADLVTPSLHTLTLNSVSVNIKAKVFRPSLQVLSLHSQQIWNVKHLPSLMSCLPNLTNLSLDSCLYEDEDEVSDDGYGGDEDEDDDEVLDSGEGDDDDDGEKDMDSTSGKSEHDMLSLSQGEYTVTQQKPLCSTISQFLLLPGLHGCEFYKLGKSQRLSV
jgi:hypothetical protein